MSTPVTENGWKIVRLGEVAKTSSGGTPKRGVSAYYGGGIPWVKSGELGDSTVYETEERISKAGLENSSAKLFPKGTLCVALYGATVGKLGILGIDAATNQAVCGIFLPDEIDTRFAYRFLESKRKELIDMGKGGAQSNISQEIIRNLEFPLPPLDEQRRIVSEIEKQFTRLDAGVSALQRVRSKLKQYRAAVLKAACEGRLVPTETEMKATPLKELIEGLGQGWSPKCDLNREPLPDEWAVITTTAVQSMRYIDNQGKPLPENLKPRPHIEIKAGDFLMTRKGPRQRAGVACLVRSTRHRLMVCDTVYRFRCVESRVLPAFLEIALNAPQVTTEIDKRKSGINDSGVSLTHDKLGSISIPLPPLAEQERIVAEVERRLSVVDELEATVTANLQRAARLRQAILQKAFSGQLVTQVTRIDKYLLRAALAAEIVFQLHREPAFGRVKLQKVFHLCEHVAELEEIQGEYLRKAAGPFDEVLFFNCLCDLEKREWFKEMEPVEYGYTYQPLKKAGEHRAIIEQQWPDKVSTIRNLIDVMRSWDTARCEMFSTLYAAWNDLLICGEEATDEAILHEVLDEWHERKKRFLKEQWLGFIQWMKEEGFAPAGFGKATAKPQ